jgi:hypothetical protein
LLQLPGKREIKLLPLENGKYQSKAGSKFSMLKIYATFRFGDSYWRCQVENQVWSDILFFVGLSVK